MDFELVLWGSNICWMQAWASRHWDSLYFVCLPDALRFHEQYDFKPLNVWLVIMYPLFANESFPEIHFSVSLSAPLGAVSWDVVAPR